MSEFITKICREKRVFRKLLGGSGICALLLVSIILSDEEIGQ